MKVTIGSGSKQDTLEAPSNSTLLEIIQKAGWHISAPCGGTGKCGKCSVEVDPPENLSPRSDVEERWIATNGNRRLACQCTPLGEVTVALGGDATPPADSHTLAKGGAIDVAPTGVPSVTVDVVELEPPTLEDQRSLHRRIADAVESRDLVSAPDVLGKARSMVVEADGAIELAAVVAADTFAPRLIDVRPADKLDLFGVAVDIGTTTIAAYLLDMASHTVIASRSEMNAQASYGADVVSRIQAAGSGSPLTGTVCEQLARMVAEIGQPLDIDAAQIVAGAIVGNTTMMHLLLGLDPAPLAVAPFAPISLEPMRIDPHSIGLPLNDHARVTLLPGISAYVGTDIMADLLATRIHEGSEISLLIDIGTNGEIVLGNRDGLVACSTAAGPAFEGATIRHGSGGVDGAINHVRREADQILIETIGEVATASICGTGLMDAVAMLRDDGVVDETGLIDADGLSGETADTYSSLLTQVDGEPAVILSQNGGKSIELTQSDIRQVQLAKGAIAAGVRTLLGEAGVGTSDVAHVYLAGGFGTYVRPESAVRVGLLPDVDLDRIASVGNAAGAGAARALLDRRASEEALDLVDRCRYLELSGSAEFQNFFIDEMFFP